jgi:hypothetical protein
MVLLTRYGHKILKTMRVVNLKCLRSILNPEKVLGQTVNFEQSRRTKSEFFFVESKERENYILLA